jgi:serine phosphatase RsbU (regulator of sigma subunit)
MLLLPGIGSTAGFAQAEGQSDLSEAEARDSISTCLRLIGFPEKGPGKAHPVELALEAWSLAREHVPGMADVCRVRLAQVYLDRGLPTKALEHAEGVLTHSPAATDALIIKAESLTASGQYREAVSAWTALSMTAKDDPSTSTRALKGLMRCCMALTDPSNAIGYGKRLLTGYQARGDRFNAGICGNDLGQLVSAEGQHIEALRYFSDAMNDLADSPAHWLVSASNRSAELVYLDRLPEALAELDKVRTRALALGEMTIADRAQLLLAAALLLDGRSMDALEKARAAQVSALGRGDTLVEVESYDLLAHICDKYGQHQQARANTMLAATLRMDVQRKEGLTARARIMLLSEAQRDETRYLQRFDEEQRGRNHLHVLRQDADNRSQLLELARAKSDMRSVDLQREVDQAEAEQRLALARTDLRAEQQKRIIQDLQVSKTTQALELARSEQEHRSRQQELDLLIRSRELQAAELERDHAQQRSGFWLMLFLFAAVLGGVVALFVMRRKNRVIGRQVEQIGRINAQLSAKNMDMLSSITYAQRIQRAIIPTEGQLRDVLPDSFLFYRPLDIVSGDLPFVRREGERLFIATIDCTGHGVPAAMLSFMAYYNLNDIISTFKDLAVGDILGLLHHRIKAALHGSMDEHAMGNGMDVTLVELDPDRRLLRYSGAQNSLLFVRDGQCQRIKGDKCSIGDSSGGTASAFRTHSIDLRPTDHVYLYSDGFVHQFGGRNGRKKFSNSQLMKTVGALADRSAHQAGTHLAAIYQDWQGDQPQTDDIVLIGFSIGQRASVMAA